VLNLITIISTFIHLCEAYHGIAPHFHMWRHFFELKKTGKAGVVSSVSFMLRRNMKSEYIDLALPDNTTSWKQGWFYLDNPASALKTRTGGLQSCTQSGPTNWRRGTPRSYSPCWMNWSGSRRKS
jgi:hypothetical protein